MCEGCLVLRMSMGVDRDGKVRSPFKTSDRASVTGVGRSDSTANLVIRSK